MRVYANLQNSFKLLKEMKRGLFLVIMAVVLCTAGASAQRISYVKNSLASKGAGGASITITEDEGVRKAVSLIESKTATPSKVKGYRFVIFHDSEQFANERASRALSAFRNIFKSVSSYLSVESPTFRILVGDCYNYEDVAILRNKIDDMYPDAALCEADIPLRFLLRYQGNNNMLIERNGEISGELEFEDVELNIQQDGQEGGEETPIIETPADVVEGEVSEAVKKPNTEVVEQVEAAAPAEEVQVIETPVAEEAKSEE